MPCRGDRNRGPTGGVFGMTRARFLNETEKVAELAYWARLIAERSSKDGPGNPDPEIIPWCEKINSIPGICTLQSCAGHVYGKRGVRVSGHFWLWLSSEKAANFKQRAFELARVAAIEKISTIYQPWGQEIALVEFRGIPDGQLESSGRAITTFLASL